MAMNFVSRMRLRHRVQEGLVGEIFGDDDVVALLDQVVRLHGDLVVLRHRADAGGRHVQRVGDLLARGLPGLRPGRPGERIGDDEGDFDLRLGVGRGDGAGEGGGGEPCMMSWASPFSSVCTPGFKQVGGVGHDAGVQGDDAQGGVLEFGHRAADEILQHGDPVAEIGGVEGRVEHAAIGQAAVQRDGRYPEVAQQEVEVARVEGGQALFGLARSGRSARRA